VRWKVHKPAPAVADLVGAQDSARRLAEWFELTFHRPELLRSFGAGTRFGVAVHGSPGAAARGAAGH
jgi:transitional endoplasmic reticulum ATPase